MRPYSDDAVKEDAVSFKGPLLKAAPYSLHIS